MVHGVGKSRTRLSDFTFTFHFHALEKETAIHSNVLAWRIPGTGEPGGLPSMGSHRVGHDCSDLPAAATTLGNITQLFTPVQSSLYIHGGLVSGVPWIPDFVGCSNPLYKIALYMQYAYNIHASSYILYTDRKV